MLVHSNSKGSALVRGVCHPSVLHTVQNDKGLVDGLAGGMWTQHCGGIRGLWWRTFRRRYEFIFQYFLSVFFIRLCMAFLSKEYLYFILYILWGGCGDICMAEERASQLSSSSVFHSLVLDLESLQRIFVLFIVYSLGWLQRYVWQRRGQANIGIPHWIEEWGTRGLTGIRAYIHYNSYFLFSSRNCNI